MATGREIETRGHIVGFKEEIGKAADQGSDCFFTWFDSAADTDIAFVRGNWDFLIHIASHLSKHLNNPEDKTILEIGHGGGRILAAACRSFNKAIGVDIHDNNDLVENELKSRGITNFKLLKSDGRKIPIADDSIDIVFSFIVLQHVEKIAIFQSYFAETHRVLKLGGVAILYFGRKHFLSHNKESAFLYRIDCLLEDLLLLKRGFQEIPAKVNEVNLIVSVRYAKRLALSLGFQVLGKVASRKKVPDGISLFGVQHGLILRKRPR